MAPIWPFGKKKKPQQLDEESVQTIVYRKEASQSEQTLADNSHRESADYTAAVSLFGNGSTTVKRAEEQSQFYEGIVDSSPNQSEEKKEFTWFHHSDGYHYKKMPDDTYDNVPHTKLSDGSFVPYSS